MHWRIQQYGPTPPPPCRLENELCYNGPKRVIWHSKLSRTHVHQLTNIFLRLNLKQICVMTTKFNSDLPFWISGSALAMWCIAVTMEI